MALEDHLVTAAAMTDPLEKAIYLQTVVMPEAQELWQEVVNARALAVLAANEAGAGSPTLANELGVSKGLIQNLVRTGRELRDGVTDPCSKCGVRQVYAKGLCYRDWQAQLGKAG